MAIFNLTTPLNGTPGGTWALADTTECSCASPNACGATLTAAGVLDITVPDVIPAVPCIVYVTYTVVNGTCSDVSVHQITVNLKSCISFSNSATSDWELHLNPLTIDNTIVTDPFVYAVVPVNAVCGDYDNAVAWGYKGNCGYTPPSNLTPKANFATSNNEQTFQVPAGDYKVVVACVGNTVLSDCEKIDCCEYEITVSDLNLCNVYSSCDPLHINYNLTTNDFTINIPMLVTKDKCVRMDFFGGGAVPDIIELQVWTTTGWEFVDIAPATSGIDYLTVVFSNSIIVKAGTIQALPNTAYLPNNSTEFITNLPVPITQYKLNWIIRRDTDTIPKETSWIADISCCDCLETCPLVGYPCITGVTELATPNCTTGCNNLIIDGLYSRSALDIRNMVNGSCSPGSTCTGNSLTLTNVVGNVGVVDDSDVDFHRPLNSVQIPTAIATGGTFCAINRTLLPANITYTIAGLQIIIDYTPANAAIYTAVKNMIDNLPVNKTNYSLVFPPLKSGTCGDGALNAMGLPAIYFVHNGVDIGITFDDALRIITIDNIYHASSTCVSLHKPPLPTEPVIYQCMSAAPSNNTLTGDILLSSSAEVARINKYSIPNYTNTYTGIKNLSNICPAFYEAGDFIIMDISNPTTTWIYVVPINDPTLCPAIPSNFKRLIMQYAAGLDPTLPYGASYTPISASGCLGWYGNSYSYIITPDTVEGFGTCYNPI